MKADDAHMTHVSAAPRVVALMPTWMASAFILETLNALAAQTCPNLEVTISDEMSVSMLVMPSRTTFALIPGVASSSVPSIGGRGAFAASGGRVVVYTAWVATDPSRTTGAVPAHRPMRSARGHAPRALPRLAAHPARPLNRV